VVEGGSFGTFNQIASLSGGDQRGNYAFTAAHFRTASTPVTPLELLPPGRPRINDSYENWTYSTKLGHNVSDNLALNWVGRFTDATLHFTGDDFSVFPSVPNAVQSIQAAHQFYQRGEAVLTALDGRLVNYFGVNYTDTFNWNKAPDPAAPGINKGDRTRYDWHSVFEPLPGQFLITGLQQETERLDTGTLMASNGTTSAFAELQTQARPASVPGQQRPLRRERRLRQSHDLPPRAGLHSSGDRVEAEGELGYRFQDTDPEPVIRRFSAGLQFFRQS
jgi:vitamin B12 transporter